MKERAVDNRKLIFGSIAFLFYIFVFFPYLKVLPLGSDTQPSAFLVALLILGLASRDLRLPPLIWVLGLVALMAFAVFFLDFGSFTAARSLFGYFSLFFVSAAAYVCARGGHPLKSGQLLAFLCAWLLLGVAQLLVDPELGKGIISAARTSEERGVVSFAVEPGYYASMMYFILLVLMAEKREFSVAGLLCVFQIVFLAQSTVVLVALAIPAAVYLLLKVHVAVRKISFWVAIGLFALFLPYLVEYLEDSRLKSLFDLLVENPALLVIADASGNSRAASIFLSISGAFDNYLMPHGFDAYADYAGSLAWEFRNIFWYLKITDRIMSGYGAVLFELGIFGLIIPVVITLAIFRHFGRAEWPRAVVLNAATHAIMFTAVPMALPAIAFLIGHLLAFPSSQRSRYQGRPRLGQAAIMAPG